MLHLDKHLYHYNSNCTGGSGGGREDYLKHYNVYHYLNGVLLLPMQANNLPHLRSGPSVAIPQPPDNLHLLLGMPEYCMPVFAVRLDRRLRYPIEGGSH